MMYRTSQKLCKRRGGNQITIFLAIWETGIYFIFNRRNVVWKHFQKAITRNKVQTIFFFQCCFHFSVFSKQRKQFPGSVIKHALVLQEKGRQKIYCFAFYRSFRKFTSTESKGVTITK